MYDSRTEGLSMFRISVFVFVILIAFLVAVILPLDFLYTAKYIAGLKKLL